MTAVVSDTSPLLCLAHLGIMGHVPSLFGTVLIPPAVVHELDLISTRSTSAPWNARYSFLQVLAPTNRGLVETLLNQLHRGEAEALALAVEKRVEWVLIDEMDGRRVAKSLGLSPLGVLGMLVRMKQKRLVPAVGPPWYAV